MATLSVLLCCPVAWWTPVTFAGPQVGQNVCLKPSLIINLQKLPHTFFQSCVQTRHVFEAKKKKKDNGNKGTPGWPFKGSYCLLAASVRPICARHRVHKHAYGACFQGEKVEGQQSIIKNKRHRVLGNDCSKNFMGRVFKKKQKEKKGQEVKRKLTFKNWVRQREMVRDDRGVVEDGIVGDRLN